MIGVKVRKGNVDKALRKLKRKVKDSGILEEYKENQYYIKKSLERRNKRRSAERRQKKQQKKFI